MFGIAKIAQLPPTDRQGYERSLKEYRDFMNSRETAYEEGYEEGELVGIEKGVKEGKRAVARNLLQLGVLPDAEIARVAGLTLDEVRLLRE